MSTRTEAEENLRVIRSLMEKATIYRAISAPGALVGGLLSLAVAGLVTIQPAMRAPERFVALWFAVLGVTAMANFLLLRRNAVRRGEPFISPGMRLALRAMAPALLGGGLAIFMTSEPSLLAVLWVLFYGLSLLAASHFAPRSICWLGRAFFTAGAALLVLSAFEKGWPLLADPRAGHVIMATTFGGFHLLYAASIWKKAPAPSNDGVA